MPPPKVIVAALLVVVALELLLWQVAGVFWGVLVHAVLAGLVLAVVAGLLVWRRRAQWRTSTSAGSARQLRRPAGAGTAAGQRARGALNRLLGRPGASAGGAGKGRGGLLGGRSTGSGRGLLGRLTGGRHAGAGRSGAPAGRTGGRPGGLMGRLGKSATGRTAGTGKGRAGGLLGRLSRGGATRSAGTGTSGGRGRAGAALGRARSGGRALVAAGRTRAANRRQPATSSKPPKKSKVLADFWQGLREGARPGRKQRKPDAGPKHASGDTTQDQAKVKPAPEEKPQQPTKEQLVKEAVQKVAKAKPAVVAPQRAGGTAMGDINKVRAAADELAASLKDYDPETMHQLVREMPQLGEALNAVSQGFRQVASRAESEWPVAAPVAEGLRSIADDIKAGAGTAEETRGTIRRENETDIERGEAPRHGSVEVERKWNV